jgi:hypothetical protein
VQGGFGGQIRLEESVSTCGKPGEVNIWIRGN